MQHAAGAGGEPQVGQCMWWVVWSAEHCACCPDVQSAHGCWGCPRKHAPSLAGLLLPAAGALPSGWRGWLRRDGSWTQMMPWWRVRGWPPMDGFSRPASECPAKDWRRPQGAGQSLNAMARSLWMIPPSPWMQATSLCCSTTERSGSSGGSAASAAGGAARAGGRALHGHFAGCC